MSARSKLVKYLTVVEILPWKLISQLLRVSKTLLKPREGGGGNLFFGIMSVLLNRVWFGRILSLNYKQGIKFKGGQTKYL